MHGGALPASTAVVDFSKRQEISTTGKVAIAKTAAAMIQPNQIVLLDGGTTTVWLARHIPKTLQATIITHSPSVAVELVDHPLLEVILIGGKLFKHSLVTMGATALETLAKIRADTFFMGATGIHPEAGITTGDFEEAQIKKAISAQAGETILLASQEKIGVASAYKIMPCDEVNGMIVDYGTSEDLLKSYRLLGINITQT